jgi:hypothetical protein
MRTLGFGLVLLGTVVGLSFGCGESERGAGAAGGAGAATGGASSGSAGKAGASATAGTASGGSMAGGNGDEGGVSGSLATTGGQADTPAGAGNAAGAGSALIGCDPKQILCKRLAPECTAGEVPSVEGSCYGDCVKVERCGCTAATDCPQPEQYTCWAKQHCGPFVE